MKFCSNNCAYKYYEKLYGKYEKRNYKIPVLPPITAYTEMTEQNVRPVLDKEIILKLYKSRSVYYE